METCRLCAGIISQYWIIKHHKATVTDRKENTEGVEEISADVNLIVHFRLITLQAEDLCIHSLSSRHPHTVYVTSLVTCTGCTWLKMAKHKTNDAPK